MRCKWADEPVRIPVSYPPVYRTPFRGQSTVKAEAWHSQGQIHPPVRCGENNTPQISFPSLENEVLPPFVKNISKSLSNNIIQAVIWPTLLLLGLSRVRVLSQRSHK
jgi:hypothetical protein